MVEETNLHKGGRRDLHFGGGETSMAEGVESQRSEGERQ
jgi:hypothetical protein